MRLIQTVLVATLGLVHHHLWFQRTANVLWSFWNLFAAALSASGAIVSALGARATDTTVASIVVNTGNEKRWLEKSQLLKEPSPLPMESPEIGDGFLHEDEVPRDWSVDEQGLPIFGADMDNLGGPADFDTWSYISETEVDNNASSSNKKPRVQNRGCRRFCNS